MCWGSVERGRPCAEYSQRIISHYLLTINRYCEVLSPKLAWGRERVEGREPQDPPSNFEDGAPSHGFAFIVRASLVRKQGSSGAPLMDASSSLG
jgi:hypothetical protein